MKHPKLAVPLLTGALLLGGTAACGAEDEGTGVEEEFDPSEEDITPGFNPGEEPVIPASPAEEEAE